MRHFDLTMTYRLDLDIVAPYLDSGCRERLRTRPAEKDDAKLVNAFVSSPYNRSRRIEFMVQLMAQIDVHFYGKLFRNRRIEGDKGSETKLETIKTYKFTLALENAIAKDYVTEKFYDPLIAGSVPVRRERIASSTSPIGKARPSLPATCSRSPVTTRPMHASLSGRQSPSAARFPRCSIGVEEHPFVRLCKTVEERLS